MIISFKTSTICYYDVSNVKILINWRFLISNNILQKHIYILYEIAIRKQL